MDELNVKHFMDISFKVLQVGNHRKIEDVMNFCCCFAKLFSNMTLV